MTQQEALDILKLGHNVYLTGSAGSGKTFLLNMYISHLKANNVEVGITASTGIAATHMNGITIHSWSGLGIREHLSNQDLRKLLETRRLTARFGKAKVLIIDEVSMLHPYQLDLVDKICKMFKQGENPFGGIQVVLCGDFFQLPPVNRDSREVNFIDKSDIWDNMDLKVCYLHEQYRHESEELAQVLNDIRKGDVGEDTLEPLRKRYKRNIEGLANPTKLYTHNANVDFINNKELKNLQGETKTYYMESIGNKKLTEILAKNCLAPEELQLKKNALVMFVKNNFEKDYVNGTLGKVIGFIDDNTPIVKTIRGREIAVEPVSWTIEEDGKIKAEIVQTPLRLAWAITVHKSQGMTLDAAEVDLSNAFVEGMGYVALSRVRNINGLKLMGLNDIALKVNDYALSLDKELIEASELVLREVGNLAPLDKTKRQEEFLRSIIPAKKEKPISTYEKTRLLVEKKLSISEMAYHRNFTEGTIIAHLEKLKASEKTPDIGYLRESLPPDRLEKIKCAFKKSGDIKLSPVMEILGEDFSYDELRLARLFLDE